MTPPTVALATPVGAPLQTVRLLSAPIWVIAADTALATRQTLVPVTLGGALSETVQTLTALY